MRKLAIGVIAGVVFLATAAVALALTNNTVSYTSSLTQSGKAKKAGTNTAYEGILDVGTSDGKQPDTAATTDVFFAKQIRNNAPKFKSCKTSDFAGKTAAQTPAKCKAAQVGGGTATAYIGQPGQPLNPTTKQDLSVKAYNGQKGKQLLLVVTGGALGAAQQVIPGKISPASGKFGYKVSFGVPAQLQGQLGAQIALTHFDVQISGTKKAKVVKKQKGKKKGKVFRVTYLQVTGCPSGGKLPTRAIVHFNNDDGTPGGENVTNDGTMDCK